MSEGPIVVKLGGSAAASPDLRRWIAAIEAAPFPLLLVPGGGPFAETVRTMQGVIGYGERAAHAMAVLAMEQFAHAIRGLGSRLEPAAGDAAIAGALGRGRIPLWLPSATVLADAAIPTSWDVTSDSLAAWIAGRLSATRLLLVKQADPRPGDDLSALTSARLVDPMLGRMLSPDTILHVAGPADLAGAANRFAGGDLPGRPVLCKQAAAPHKSG